MESIIEMIEIHNEDIIAKKLKCNIIYIHEYLDMWFNRIGNRKPIHVKLLKELNDLRYKLVDLAIIFNCSTATIITTKRKYHITSEYCKKLTFDIVSKQIYEINNNIILTTIAYNSTHDIVEATCLLDNYVWNSSFKHLKEGHGCPKCAGSIKLTNDTIDKRIKDRHIKRLGNYVGDKIKIKWECLVCHNKWETTYGIIKRGSGCPTCARYNHPGTYGQLSKELADNLDYSLYLYHVKLQYEDEIFYKYGLTKNIDRQRYKKYNPYKVIEEISFEGYDAWTAIQLEKGLKSNYIPKHKFGGYSECYIK